MKKPAEASFFALQLRCLDCLSDRPRYLPVSSVRKSPIDEELQNSEAQDVVDGEIAETTFGISRKS